MEPRKKLLWYKVRTCLKASKIQYSARLYSCLRLYSLLLIDHTILVKKERKINKCDYFEFSSFISYNRRELWLNEPAVKRVNGIDNDSTLWSQLSLLKNGPRKEQAMVAVRFYIQTGKGRCTYYGKLEIETCLTLAVQTKLKMFQPAGTMGHWNKQLANFCFIPWTQK